MNCIALLRGINVGGKNRITMPELLDVFRFPGIRHAKTWLQSGNVVFETDEGNVSFMEPIISARITDILELNVTVLVRTSPEWKDIIYKMPWTAIPAEVAEHGHVTFLQTVPDPQKTIDLHVKQEEGEFWVLKGREVYLYCPFGYGRTKLTNSVFERKLDTAATTRNWKTVLALNAMLDS